MICGLKLTHDGGVAVIDGDRLVFSTEIEKIGNNDRHQPMRSLKEVQQILLDEGIDPSSITHYVVDGWHDGQDGLAHITLDNESAPVLAAGYNEESTADPFVKRFEFSGLSVGDTTTDYSSYRHATNHATSAYCTSPFLRRGEGSLVLVWDGGMLPRLYEFAPGTSEVKSHGPLFMLHGNAFTEFSTHFGPFTYALPADGVLDRNRPNDVAGKAMAYAGLGSVSAESFAAFDTLIDSIGEISIDASTLLAQAVIERREELFASMTDADLIASFQEYLGVRLEESLARMLRRLETSTKNLCFVGGCALNIKWNSRLRRSGLFADVWVPPFPNDAGSAIGAACSEKAIQDQKFVALDWDVYSGPAAEVGVLPEGWTARDFSIAQLAELLATVAQPVVVLTGRAELGPRALGHRSIIAPAIDAVMKDRLNEMKKREPYRPVAPMCLESEAPKYFEPGTRDPFMLFDHRVRDEYLADLTTITHVDQTARLQTVSPDEDPLIAELLATYGELTGFPILCNTSANYKGRGFFPDVESAAAWGEVQYIWSDGVLFESAGTK